MKAARASCPRHTCGSTTTLRSRTSTRTHHPPPRLRLLPWVPSLSASAGDLRWDPYSAFHLVALLAQVLVRRPEERRGTHAPLARTEARHVHCAPVWTGYLPYDSDSTSFPPTKELLLVLLILRITNIVYCTLYQCTVLSNVHIFIFAIYPRIWVHFDYWIRLFSYLRTYIWLTCRSELLCNEHPWLRLEERRSGRETLQNPQDGRRSRLLHLANFHIFFVQLARSLLYRY